MCPQAVYTNSSIDERGETAEDEEDHTYELLLSAETKVPCHEPHEPSSQTGESSHQGFCSFPFLKSN